MFDERSHLYQQRFDVLFGRFDKEFALVLAHILPQKVEASVDVGQPGFFG